MRRGIAWTRLVGATAILSLVWAAGARLIAPSLALSLEFGTAVLVETVLVPRLKKAPVLAERPETWVSKVDGVGWGVLSMLAILAAIFVMGWFESPDRGRVEASTPRASAPAEPRSLEGIAATIANEHNARANTLLDDVMVTNRAIARGTNVRIEVGLRVRAELPEAQRKQFAQAIRSDTIPAACGANAGNEAFARGLNYTFVYTSVHGQLLDEFPVDKKICDAIASIAPAVPMEAPARPGSIQQAIPSNVIAPGFDCVIPGPCVQTEKPKCEYKAVMRDEEIARCRR